MFVVSSNALSQQDAGIIRCAKGRRPIHLVGAISVDQFSIGQNQPCGFGGELSIVAGDNLHFYDEIRDKLTTAKDEIKVEYQERLLCAHLDFQHQMTSQSKTAYLFSNFNLVCHRRHLFGGCNPMEVLRPDLAVATFPQSPTSCQSRRLSIEPHKYEALRENLFGTTPMIPYPPADEHYLFTNITGAKEEKTWQFQDGNSAKHFTTQFAQDQMYKFFGNNVDEFVDEQKNGRFLLYLCQGTLYPCEFA